MLHKKRNFISASSSSPSQPINTTTNNNNNNNNIPLKTETFLLKLTQILTKTKYSSAIHWSDDGKAIIISNINDFTNNVIPKYFKHCNYDSFVRQLNMYNFHKLRSTRNQSEHVFQHELFTRDHTNEGITNIKRKIKYDCELSDLNGKNDYEIINVFVEALQHKLVTKNAIKHMLVFLLNKMKENLIVQSKLNERIKELVVENEELKRKQKEEMEGNVKEQYGQEEDDDALFESGFFNC
jgi:hypothetical protein